MGTRYMPIRCMPRLGEPGLRRIFACECYQSRGRCDSQTDRSKDLTAIYRAGEVSCSSPELPAINVRTSELLAVALPTPESTTLIHHDPLI
jgi:hypothetical protein